MPFKRQGAARRTQCLNKIKQIVFALHNYHDVHDDLPALAWGTPRNFVPGVNHDNRISIQVTLCSFLEQTAIYEASWNSSYGHWDTTDSCFAKEPDVYRCPSKANSTDSPIPFYFGTVCRVTAYVGTSTINS
ncbi:MAG: DUF1559 domain-containing protein [Planctomycetaceae bacterium]|nr:DUF1559 domain-containing protein [Planctomycetaceae bacterium]